VTIKQEDIEDLWGYGKRLRFVRHSIAAAFKSQTPAQLKILDVGCGNGSQLALPLAKDGFNVTGIDTDGSSIAHAQALSGQISNAVFRCGRIEEFPNLEPFDVVILSEVLEHVNDPQALLAKSVACLAPEGVLIVTVPNGYGEFEIDSWLFRKLRLQKIVDKLVRQKHEVLGSTNNCECGHVQFFTRSRLARLFDECDLALLRAGSGSFFAGPIAGHVLARSQRFIEWNARVTDHLPYSCASGWYFALKPRRACGETIGSST